MKYGLMCFVLIVVCLIACAFARSGVVPETRPAVITLGVLGGVDSSLLDDAKIWLPALGIAMASRTETGPAATSARDGEAVAS